MDYLTGRYKSLFARTLWSSTVQGMAREAISQMPKGRVILVGHSLGGYIAQTLMLRVPERIKKVMLLSTSARALNVRESKRRYRILKLLEGDYPRTPSFYAAIAKQTLSAENARNSKIVRLITHMLQSAGIERIRREHRAIIYMQDRRSLLASFDKPVLLIAGKQDRITPPALTQEMGFLLPRASVHILEGAGHMVMIERPREVNLLMDLFLSEKR